MRNSLRLCLIGVWIGLACKAGLTQVDPEIDARLERRWHPFQDADWPYRLFVPDDYAETREYPLILFLHGAMWRGTDNITHLDNELAVFWVQDAVQFIRPCFVVLPQIPAGRTWEVVSGPVDTFPSAPMLEMVINLLDSLKREFSIDSHRIACAGKSIGGLGVYGLLSRYPDRFAAAMPVAGMTMYRDISQISGIPIWILHAKDDPAVPIDLSLDLVRLLEQEGPPFIYTHCNESLEDCDPIPPDSMDQVIAAGVSRIISIFDTATHQIEPRVVRTHGLADWLLSQRRDQTGIPATGTHRSSPVGFNYPNPFNAGTMIQFKLNQSGDTDVVICNTAGRRVRQLLSRTMRAGTHRLHWNSRDDAGQRLPSGLYFCLIRTDRFIHVQKLLLLR